jgi:phenylpyruvate tautomerase PptA (4-oxalocrotonate tautomerase family)
MPTYAVTTSLSLTAEQKKSMAEAIAEIHSQEAAAPRFFVQVLFYSIEAGSIFIGGDSASPEHVWVNALIRAGRSKEQKAAILTRIVGDVSRILGVSDMSVWVYISDIPAHGVLEFGNILPEPGGEKEWLASLPDELRDKLQQAG